MAKKHNADNEPTDILAQVENSLVWVSEEDDGEKIYHVELGLVTLHMFSEDWEDLVDLIQTADQISKS